MEFIYNIQLWFCWLQVEFLICLVLTLLGYVPGIIYALYVIVFQNRDEYFDEARRPLYYSAWKSVCFFETVHQLFVPNNKLLCNVFYLCIEEICENVVCLIHLFIYMQGWKWDWFYLLAYCIQVRCPTKMIIHQVVC